MAQRTYLRLSTFCTDSPPSPRQFCIPPLMISISDQTRLLALSDHSRYACAWLQVLPFSQLGLVIPPVEFVVDLPLVRDTCIFRDSSYFLQLPSTF